MTSVQGSTPMFQGSKPTVKTRLQKSFSTGTLFNDAKQNTSKPNFRSLTPSNQKKIQSPRFSWLKKRPSGEAPGSDKSSTWEDLKKAAKYLNSKTGRHRSASAPNSKVSTPFSMSKSSLVSETQSKASENMPRDLLAPLTTSTGSSTTRRRSASEPLQSNVNRNSDSSFRLSQISTPEYLRRLDQIMGNREISIPTPLEPVKAVQIPPGENRATLITGGLNRGSRLQEKEELHRLLASKEMNPETDIHVYEHVHVTEEANPHPALRKSSFEANLSTNRPEVPPEVSEFVDAEKTRDVDSRLKGAKNRDYHGQELLAIFGPPITPTLPNSNAIAATSTSAKTLSRKLFPDFGKPIQKLAGALKQFKNSSSNSSQTDLGEIPLPPIHTSSFPLNAATNSTVNASSIYTRRRSATMSDLPDNIAFPVKTIVTTGKKGNPRAIDEFGLGNDVNPWDIEPPPAETDSSKAALPNQLPQPGSKIAARYGTSGDITELPQPLKRDIPSSQWSRKAFNEMDTLTQGSGPLREITKDDLKKLTTFVKPGEYAHYLNKDGKTDGQRDPEAFNRQRKERPYSIASISAEEQMPGLVAAPPTAITTPWEKDLENQTPQSRLPKSNKPKRDSMTEFLYDTYS